MILLIHFIVVPILLFIDTKIGMKFRIDLQTFPDIFEMTYHISIAIIFEDFFFFWAHYTLHNPILYKLIHK